MSINQKFYLPIALAFALLSLLVVFGVSYQQYHNIQQSSVNIEDRLLANLGSTKSPIRNTNYNIQSIRSAKLFAVKKKIQKKTIKAKKTQLKLTLDGIIAATDQTDMSRAVIRSNNKKSLAYSIGEKIEGTNARLHSVEAQRVLIDRAGVIESLELKREKIDL